MEIKIISIISYKRKKNYQKKKKQYHLPIYFKDQIKFLRQKYP